MGNAKFMKVSIIGPGAMGILYAARFSKSGIQTTLVDYRSSRAQALTESGITLDSEEGNTIKAKVPVVLEVPPKQDLILVLVKAGATSSLDLPAGVPVLTLQSGLGNVEKLCNFVGSSTVLVGTTTETASLIDPGHVRHVTSGVTTFGAWTSCPTAPAEEALKTAGFAYELTGSPGQMIWENVAILAGINPLTALLDIPNGQLLTLEEPRQLMRNLVVEAAKVASTEGYRFEYSLVERAEQVCQETSENFSTMLQDIRASRRTEIDYISGEILRKAELASLPAPRTRAVWQLVRGLEDR
jgi:2-dehydropantoate 2-reductase